MADAAYRTADVDGLTLFYREAGAADAPTLVLLHGFPSASHQFRELIPLLADRFHVVAPDLPGFGKSDMPPRGEFSYTFDHLADVIDRWTEVLGLDSFALYVFDYGAPVGFRIATRHPERITAIISQNGNAYEEGLSDGWNPIQAYWKDPSQANRDAIRMLLEPQTTVWQYTHGVPDTTRVSPRSASSSPSRCHQALPSGPEQADLDVLGPRHWVRRPAAAPGDRLMLQFALIATFGPGSLSDRARWLTFVQIWAMRPAGSSEFAARRVAGPGAGGVVPRPELWGRLGASPRVTMVAAPPGSGKTVLLRSWLGEAGLVESAAWVSVGRDERDPQRL